MTREEKFEKMLEDVQAQYAQITVRMDVLKSENKTKTATFRQLMGNRLMLQSMLSMYRSYGLTE